MNYRAVLTFHPEQANPARPSGKGVWRIFACHPFPGRTKLQVGVTGARGEFRHVLFMTAPREFKVRSRVDPAKWIGRQV